MSFQRQPAESWQRDVPGARWFKADLHIHTIDDRPGGRPKMPTGLSGDPDSPQTLALYARCFLQALVERGVQVAGLTPHSPRAGVEPETSAVWRIVEEWNTGTDDNGVPFREKIYAVFPGFEPSFRDGRQGLHLLFLFDPEIGRERYLRAFDLVMGGVSPWRDGDLQISNERTADAFAALRVFQGRECTADAGGGRSWDYLVLAPHIEAENGLLGAQKAQVLQLFDHEEVAGLELADEKLPEETLKRRPWLRDGMATRRQAFFHASDAYRVDDIGQRHTWMKLASPRLEALRQAFIASDSRMRIGFERGDDGVLRPIGDPPDVTVSARPWLREMTVAGGASFFGGSQGGEARQTRFRLSPDLTCIIGGSMTGKSTFLDGLRVHVDARLPDDEAVRANVAARGQIFGAGAPDIALDCPGRDPTAPPLERWPARFFAQNELQRLSQEGGAVEDILARLVPSEIEGIERRDGELRDLDKRLSDVARQLDKFDERMAEAEQAYQRANSAKQALAVFSEAGVEDLHRAGRERQEWEGANLAASNVRGGIQTGTQLASMTTVPDIGDALAEYLTSEGIDPNAQNLSGRWKRIMDRVEAAVRDLDKLIADIRDVMVVAANRETDLRIDVERALAERGLDAAKLKEFQELDRQASLLPSYAKTLAETGNARRSYEQRFSRLQGERRALVEEQREAFDRVMDGIGRAFEDRIRVRRVENGDVEPLGRFLEKLRQKGITRWWNGLSPERKPSSEALIANLEDGTLNDVEMSSAVQMTFLEALTRSRRLALAALRCADRYVLELRMDGGGYRPLGELSGGQRVSVLLSLLLETADNRPLVIDQPEDELDNRFLSDTVLPVLKKLRGRRQVIVATHNPNIVVNGDADMVIQLDASAKRGRIVCAGAIEEPAVRDAIVRTVDGGEEAFRLRRRKYGF